MSRFRYNRIGVPSIARPPERYIGELLEDYLAKWQAVREARVVKCLADMLGHAREHTAIVEVPPRHAMSRSLCAYYGIDRTAHPESLAGWRSSNQEPFSIATFREAMVRLLAYEPPPPAKPWITRQRAAQLEAEGVRRSLIEAVFEIY
ncbi:MAG TPA: hypothetical protein VMZ53_03650 [Kofleriaceae bacterium]|nr:hypothetical protein [Kofleriaceae bacterium]